MGKSLDMTKYKRVAREANGRNIHDPVELYKFKDLEVGNVPHCGTDWHHIFYQETDGAKRYLYFCINSITFKYNTVEEYLLCDFKYIVWAQYVEKIDEKNRSRLVQGAEIVNGYGTVWGPA
jgi:hypothetical protein